MKNISLKIPESLYLRLSSLAEKRGESKSAIIRTALDRFVSKESTVKNKSCIGLAEDLTGIVSGPENVSYEKSHLKDYGK